MHQHAELGVAAHWRYKEGGHFDPGYEEKIAWLRQLLEWKDEEHSANDFVDRFKSEAFQERVYVLTPGAKSSICRRAQRRLISPMPCTPRSATVAGARRSMGVLCR